MLPCRQDYQKLEISTILTYRAFVAPSGGPEKSRGSHPQRDIERLFEKSLSHRIFGEIFGLSDTQAYRDEKTDGPDLCI